jgi:hypothetical protein
MLSRQEAAAGACILILTEEIILRSNVAHLTCKEHSQRIMVLSNSIIHRSGTSCNSAVLQFGDKRFDANYVREHGKLSTAESSIHITKTGKILTDADINALADEAEQQGYDATKIVKRLKKEK